MARLNANGVALNVETWGAGEPLLLLHGFTGSTATWERLATALAARRRVIAVDLIGHGASDAPAEPERYAMSRCITDLLTVLDRLDIERTAVLGYSMGARVALHLAVTAPARVTSLILESGSPGIDDEAERAGRRAADEMLARRIMRDGVEAFVDEWERLPLFASQRALSPTTRLELRRQRLRNSAIGLANSLRGMGTGAQASLWGSLSALTMPVLVIAGALDDTYERIGRAMVAALPRGRLVVAPDAGHAVHLEQVDTFRALVADAAARDRMSPCLNSRQGQSGG